MTLLKTLSKFIILTSYICFALCLSGLAQSVPPLKWTYMYTNSIIGSTPEVDSLYQVDGFLLKTIKRLHIKKEITINPKDNSIHETENSFYTIDNLELIDLNTDSVYKFSIDTNNPVLLGVYQYHKGVKSYGFNILQFRDFEEKISKLNIPVNKLNDTLVNGHRLHIIELLNEQPLYLSIDPNIHTPFNVSFNINGQTITGALIKMGSKIGTEIPFVDSNYSYEATVPEDKIKFINTLRKIIQTKRIYNLKTDQIQDYKSGKSVFRDCKSRTGLGLAVTMSS